MGDSKLYTRVKVADILIELKNYEKKPRSTAYQLTILKKIVVNMTLGDNEVIVLFDRVVRLLETLGKDPVARHLCYLYITTYWRYKPTEAMRAVKYITDKYRKHSLDDQIIDLKTLAQIQLPAVSKLIVPLIEKAMKSKSPQMRQCAAYCTAQVFKTTDSQLIDQLNALLHDERVDVVAAALTALGDITDKDDTLALSVDEPHATTLVESLSECDEWTQVSILNSLMSFVPQTHEIASKLIDTLLPYLQQKNSSIVLNTLKVVVYLCNYVPGVLDVYPSLPRLLSAAVASLMLKPPEIQFLAMRNVILLLLDKPALLDLDIRMFFCQYDDLVYIKDTKLEIIFLLADEDNMDIVLEEMQEYASEIDIQMVRKSIRAIGNLAVKIETTSDMCVSVLLELLDNSVSYVVQEIAVIARDILRQYPGQFPLLISQLAQKVDLLTEPESKASMTWIVGEYYSAISNAPDLLARFSEEFLDEDAEIQSTLLTSVVKSHLTDPTNLYLREIVVNLLNLSSEVQNPDVRDRALFYIRLIESRQPCLSIVKPELPPLDTETETLPADVLEDLELNIGTLSSIYLRPVKQVFRHAKGKSLTRSPAFVNQDLKTKTRPSRASTVSRTSSLMKTATRQMNSITLENNHTGSSSGSFSLKGLKKKLKK